MSKRFHISRPGTRLREAQEARLDVERQAAATEDSLKKELAESQRERTRLQAEQHATRLAKAQEIQDVLGKMFATEVEQNAVRANQSQDEAAKSVRRDAARKQLNRLTDETCQVRLNSIKQTVEDFEYRVAPRVRNHNDKRFGRGFIPLETVKPGDTSAFGLRITAPSMSENLPDNLGNTSSFFTGGIIDIVTTSSNRHTKDTRLARVYAGSSIPYVKRGHQFDNALRKVPSHKFISYIAGASQIISKYEIEPHSSKSIVELNIYRPENYIGFTLSKDSGGEPAFTTKSSALEILGLEEPQAYSNFNEAIKATQPYTKAMFSPLTESIAAFETLTDYADMMLGGNPRIVDPQEVVATVAMLCGREADQLYTEPTAA